MILESYPYKQVVKVTKSSDFGVIDSSKVYFIDGIVDMTGVTIEVPAAGIYLTGHNFDVSKLVCADNSYTMFTSPIGGSGNFLGKDYAIEVTGTGSKVYDLVDATGFNAFEFTRINYNNCTSLGVIDGYRQGLEEGTGRFGGSPSLTLEGNWLGGYRITTSIVRSMSDVTTEPLFKKGASFTMQSRFLTDINCDLGTLQPLLDFNAANFPNAGTLRIRGAEITRDGVYNAEDTNITPNITQMELPCYWKENNGINNTYVGGTALVVLQAATTITVQGQYEQVNASAWLGTGLEHFTVTSDGKLQHDGNSPREFEINYDFRAESTANNDIYLKFYKYDFLTTTESPLDYTAAVRNVNNLVGGRDLAFFTGNIGVTLDKGDQLIMKIMNNSSTADITIENGGYFRVQER